MTVPFFGTVENYILSQKDAFILHYRAVVFASALFVSLIIFPFPKATDFDIIILT